MAINLPIVSKFDDSGIKRAEKEIGNLSGTLKKLGGVLAAAFSVAAITSFTKEAILGAEAAEVASKRLDQVAKSMNLFGEETQKVANRLKNYAEAHEFSLGVDADVIKSTQAKLLTFKELAQTADTTGGSFDRATKAALDLAATGFGTAETNAVQLGKALNDPIKGITALARAGVTFTEQEKEKIKALVESGNILEAQNLVLSAIETQVGGTAEATATASTKMTLAFNAMKDGVGEALLPAFQNLTKSLTPLIVDLGPKLGAVFAAFVPVIDKIVAVLPSLFDALIPLTEVFAQIAVLVADVAIAVMPVFISILEALLPAVNAILPILAQFLTELIKPLVPAIQTLVTAFQPLLDMILPVLVELLNALMPILVALMEDGLTALIPVLANLIAAFAPLLAATLPLLVDILQTVVIPAIRLVGSVVTQVFGSAVKFIGTSLGGIMEAMIPFVKAFKDAWTGISNFMRPIINGILGFIQAMVNGVVDGVNGVIRALNRIQVEIPDWVPGIGGQTFGFAIPTLSRVAIPRLAEGGVVMPQPGGIIANIAEAGKPEAVIPLDRFGDMGGKTVNLNITVNAGMGADGSTIGQKIVDEIIRYERSSGQVFARA